MSLRVPLEKPGFSDDYTILRIEATVSEKKTARGQRRAEAEAKSFAQIMAPVRKAAGTVDEAEIVKLVEKARADFYRKRRTKKG
jgi:hypothetical protein